MASQPTSLSWKLQQTATFPRTTGIPDIRAAMERGAGWGQQDRSLDHQQQLHYFPRKYPFPSCGENPNNSSLTSTPNLSQCTSMATTCTSYTKATATGTALRSRTPQTLSAATCRCCVLADTSSPSMTLRIQGCGLFTVISRGIFRLYVYSAGCRVVRCGFTNSRLAGTLYEYCRAA